MAVATTPRGKIRAGIDRKKENELVLRFQKNPENSYLFNQIYEPRIPTIRHLSKKFSFVAEDIESEITVVFIRSLEKFQSSRRDFNTFFYTNCLNHIRNLLKAKKRQKRTLIDGSDPALSMLRLDSEQYESDNTFHEVVPSQTKNVISDVSVSEMLESVKNESWVLYDVMVEIASYGSPCLSRRIYKETIVVQDHETDEEAIARDINIPDHLYEIEECFRDGPNLSYTINVSGQKTVKHLSSYLKNKGFASSK